MLTFIKFLHTVVWVLLAGSVVCIPLLAFWRRFRAARLLSMLVWFECVVLFINEGRCPLTDVAARYTADRAPNFDIYLPLWLAEHNKQIFGTLFLLSQLVLLACWYCNSRISTQQLRNSGVIPKLVKSAKR